MNAIVVGAFAFLIISPAICDEGLTKNSYEKEIVTKNPQPYFNNLDNENLIDSDWYERQVRAPSSGFYGVRGKKYYYDDDDDEWMTENEFKRAPSGFVGMRGRRYDYNYQPSFIDNDDYQAQLYHELQKEREMLAALIEDYYNADRDKRKPVGFIGSRGKKSVNNDDYFDDEKRSPMGFTGVRGKKSEFPNFIRMDEKRVPVASFFGMRGKKQPVSNFFGVNKKPFFPYGKFVGVRGKKTPDGSIRRFALSSDELNNGLLQPASLVGADTVQNKRIGFVGSRG
ncbi:hypothetical protein PVAND_009519 [Polypedilum vanderplanki]|uniref:Uncharacterized protein n=1 Tax=Polypedilum vanderplanki TaxID=319348 RepID=A0A9J6CDU1_POLVA|nr:hypothetical protein PVAND_009519 [Polypedilum vanderplanki]